MKNKIDLPKFYREWPRKIGISALIVAATALIAFALREVILEPSTIVFMMGAGFIGLAFGFEKHNFGWKKYLVAIAGLLLTLVGVNLSPFSFAGAWWQLPLVVIMASWFPTFDEIVEEKWKLFPDPYTALLCCNFIATTLWLIR